MAYAIKRTCKNGKTRYVGMYKSKDGKYKSAGTYDTPERAVEVAAKQERHLPSLLQETAPASKATMTIHRFCTERFLPLHNIGAATRQGYAYTAKNHILPYIGHLRISEAERETFYNLLVKVLPSQEVSRGVIVATRKVLSAMCQMALDEGYRKDNPLRTIRLPQAPTKRILVADHDQWRRLEEALAHPPARLFARLNVTSWARRCEMISLRPCDFEFDKQVLNITRSTVYVTAKYHPSGRSGWLTKPHPKNGDWRRFAISKQMCVSLQDHIEEHSIGPEDLLFPHWMFAYQKDHAAAETEEEELPPLVSKSGLIYQHGTKAARYGMKCTCTKCRAFAADYQREWRRKRAEEYKANGQLLKTDVWRRDGTEFLGTDVWNRFWHKARTAAGLPEGFTPYNARHTGISWAIDKGVDLQKVRQRAGHGSLSITSRYAAILNEQDTTLAETLEEIFNNFGH
ncbi:site-specific integrase [Actinocorallia libanotica]|uniref:Tyr recombinase domain-containing protein n=1 Tax=Actinocorallia libanotica TaxID=46162 RepID=A0ABN1RZR5_9ACTN